MTKVLKGVHITLLSVAIVVGVFLSFILPLFVLRPHVEQFLQTYGIAITMYGLVMSRIVCLYLDHLEDPSVSMLKFDSKVAMFIATVLGGFCFANFLSKPSNIFLPQSLCILSFAAIFFVVALDFHNKLRQFQNESRL